MAVAPVPDPAEAPWPDYASAVVELLLDGEHLVLTPLPNAGGAEGDGGTREDGARLARSGGPVWVLTAGDPYPAQLDAAENAARNARLRAELEGLGVRHGPALGRSPDGSTSEVSIAVRDTDRRHVLAAAARHGQLAVFEVDERIRCIDVATGAVVTERAYRLERAPAGSDRLVGPTGWRG